MGSTTPLLVDEAMTSQEQETFSDQLSLAFIQPYLRALSNVLAKFICVPHRGQKALRLKGLGHMIEVIISIM